MAKFIGVTGTFGSGKSTVGKILESCGVKVIDSDDIVHDLLDNFVPIKEAVLKRFGQHLARADGTIDRRALADIVFTNPQARKDLESIIHPAVRAVARAKASEDDHDDKLIVAMLIPLLFESGLQEMFTEVWSVNCPYDEIVKRLMAQGNLTMEQIEQRTQAQMPQEKKDSLADAVIDNSGSVDNTRTQVERLLQELREIGLAD